MFKNLNVSTKKKNLTHEGALRKKARKYSSQNCGYSISKNI